MQKDLEFTHESDTLPVVPLDHICKQCPYYMDLNVNSVCVPLRRATEKFSPEQTGKGIRYLLVGEAPGANEDAEGLPFVGASGLLLDKVLNSLIPNRLHEVGITNAVRCRPVNNKNPSVKAKRACIDYLKQEVAKLPDLEVIILLGTQALTTLFPKISGGVGATRLKTLKWEGYPTLATFHPAAVLYDKSKGPHLFDDMYAYVVQEIWNEDKQHEAFPVEIVNTVDDLNKWKQEIQEAKRIALDIETVNFSNRILTIGTYIHEEE